MMFARHLVCFLDGCLAPLYVALTISAAISLVNPQLSQLASHGKTRLKSTKSVLESDVFLVEKRYFLHFYIVGIVSLSIALCNLGRDTAISPVALRPSLAALTLHLVRRFLECLMVHQWQSTSKMHLAGYLLGMLHYSILPLVFFDLSWACSDSSTSSKQLERTEELPAARWILLLLALGFSIWAQYQQHRHHCILAQMRKDKDDTYALPPQQGWFPWVSCPHYLAEIFIYSSLVALLRLERIETNGQQWCLLAWVTVNLTVSALKNHRWYRAHIKDFESLGRKAIFPWIL